MFLAAAPGCLNHLAELNDAERVVVRHRGRRQALADAAGADAFVGRQATSTIAVSVHQGPARSMPVMTTLPAGLPFSVLNAVPNDGVLWIMVQAGPDVGYTPFLPWAMQSTGLAIARATSSGGVAVDTRDAFQQQRAGERASFPAVAAAPSAGTPPAPAAPGFGSLIWRTVTGAGQGLFQCRPDSWFCAGSGAQAYGPGGPGAGAPPAANAPMWFYLAGGAALLIGVKLVLGAR